VINFNTTK